MNSYSATEKENFSLEAILRKGRFWRMPFIPHLPFPDSLTCGKAKAILLNCTNNRKEKSLRHVAMVAKFLDDKKPIKSLKSLCALFQTSLILFNFI